MGRSFKYDPSRCQTLVSMQKCQLRFRDAEAETETAALTPVTMRYSEARKRVPDCALLFRSKQPMYLLCSSTDSLQNFTHSDQDHTESTDQSPT